METALHFYILIIILQAYILRYICVCVERGIKVAHRMLQVIKYTERYIYIKYNQYIYIYIV